jgi:protein phosphatase
MLLSDLEQAVATGNDKISQQNDSEHRQGRQRMGTTIVMALPMAHEMYITHVGDSRAYWITRHNCHQVTLDDDVASL